VSHRAFSTWADFAASARAAGILIVAALTVACEPEAVRPRSFDYFNEDGIAREGVLARCNLDRDASENDVECANARHAASAVAAEIEQARSSELAAQSERKLSAMRDRSARAQQAEQQAAAAEVAAAEAAYEAQYRDPKAGAEAPTSEGAHAPAFGAPLGRAMPSTRDDAAYNLESLSQVPTRPELELAAVSPPVSEIVQPELEIERNAIIPRPFRSDDETIRR